MCIKMAFGKHTISSAVYEMYSLTLFLALLVAALPLQPTQTRHGLRSRSHLPPPCTGINESFAKSYSPVPANLECILLPGNRCIEYPPICPLRNDKVGGPPLPPECSECRCLFDRQTCNSPSYCSQALSTLGINCSDSADPIESILLDRKSTSNEEEIDMCLSKRICGCLFRGSSNSMLVEAEEHCRSLCVEPSNNNTTTPPTNRTGMMRGGLSGAVEICDIVHGHYCRRHTRFGRTSDCARQCTQQNFCPRLIEVILDGEYEGNDVDAAIAVMREFDVRRTNRLHSRVVLQTQESFFRVIENDGLNFISHLNNNNSQDLISLFDDLLSDERQEELDELVEEGGSPGEEVLDRIEITAGLLGASYQQIISLENNANFGFIGNNIEVDVECQSTNGYQHIFSKGLEEEAELFIPNVSSDSATGGNNCTRVIAAALSANLGKLLNDNETNETVASEVMTINVVDGVKAGTVPYVLITFLSLKKSFNTPQCVFWNSTLRQWSAEGIKLVSVNKTAVGTYYTCNSSHLSSFAVLTSTKPIDGIPEEETKALSIVSYIGCGISILSILLTLILLLVFRKTLNKGVLLYIHLNLFLALLLALVLFVSGLETVTHIKWLCTTVAALLHYLFLSVFCWMLAEGIALYALVIRPFATNFKKWYYLLPLGWGLPVPIVAISVGLRHKYYGNDLYCWLSHDRGLHASFIGPMLIIIAINTVILILTVASIVSAQRKASEGNENKHLNIVKVSVKSTVILLPLLGITWIIGLFAVDKHTTVFAWAFTILNSLQGVMIFVLHILRNKKLWSLLRKKMDLRNITEYTSTGKSSTLPKGHQSSNGDVTKSCTSSGVPVTDSVQYSNSPVQLKRTYSRECECQDITVSFS